MEYSTAGGSRNIRNCRDTSWTWLGSRGCVLPFRGFGSMPPRKVWIYT